MENEDELQYFLLLKIKDHHDRTCDQVNKLKAKTLEEAYAEAKEYLVTSHGFLGGTHILDADIVLNVFPLKSKFESFETLSKERDFKWLKELEKSKPDEFRAYLSFYKEKIKKELEKNGL